MHAREASPPEPEDSHEDELAAAWPERWRETLDLIADIAEASCVLLCQVVGDGVRIVVSNTGNTGPLRDGAQLLLADMRSVDSDSVLSYPLHRSDGSVFGLLSAIRHKGGGFSRNGRTLMARVALAMETERQARDENLRLQREIAAHERTTRALRTSEQLHANAQRIAQIGHWHHDLASGELTWSDELFRIREVAKSQFATSYEAFLELVHPEDRQPLQEAFKRAVAEKREFQFDYRLLMPDGRIKWMAAQSVVNYDSNGTPVSSSGTTQDITARKEIERSLRESEALHRKAQKLAQIGHWRLDLVINHLDWSEQQYEIFEIDPKRFAASYEAFLNLVHPDERAALNAAYTNSVTDRTEYFFEHRLVMPDGRVKWVIERAYTYYGDDGTPLASVGTTQDITARKESKRERDMLAHIVAELGEMVFIGDPSANIIYANTAVRKRIAPGGLTLPVHALDIIVPEQHELVTTEIIPRLLAGNNWQGELTYRVFGSEQRVDAHVLAFGITDAASGALSHIVNVSLDITEHKAAEKQRAAFERQLLHVQKLESLGVMAGGIAHDFNNILQAILGNLELVAPTTADRASLDALMRARQGALRAGDITRQLLSFAGRDSELRQRADLGQVVEECANLMRAVVNKRIHLEVVSPQLPLPIDAAPGQVQQVLMNLVTNAADAIGNTMGTIDIRVGRTDTVAAAKAGFLPPDGIPAAGMAFVQVRDTGGGMDEETLARLFEPFFTRKSLGRGLGMASVMGIVRSHGGAIEVESTPGVGSRIRVLFPCAAAAEKSAAPVMLQPETCAFGHVLLVDDDDSIRKVGQALLQRRGFQVTTAACGEDAVALLDAKKIPYECVVLDLTMPGMDGADVFRFLRQRHPDLPVLLSSGFDQAEALRRIGTSTHIGFIQKPWHSEDLFSALAMLLRRVV